MGMVWMVGDGEAVPAQLYSGHVFGDHLSLLNGVPWGANKRKTSSNALAATALARVRDAAASASIIISAREVPGCFFPPDAERTYDRSFAHFARLVASGKLG